MKIYYRIESISGLAITLKILTPVKIYYRIESIRCLLFLLFRLYRRSTIELKALQQLTNIKTA